MEPRFSVIIAVYNGESTIGRAIDSILGQTFPAHEIIVIDDGSTDNTKQKIASFGERVRYIHQENSGVAAARNLGARLATGDWLCFLDADDYYYPQRLAWQAELLARHSGLDFMTGNFDYVDPDGNILRRSMESTPVGRKLLASAKGELYTLMAGGDIGGFITQHFGDTHTLALPRNTFLELGGYPEGVAVCEDVNLLIRLCARSQTIGVVCRPMAAYVIHSHSATRSNPLRAQQETLRALLPLRNTLSSASPMVRKGLEGCIRHARLDLAYVLIKEGKHWQAVRAVLPLLKDQPGLRSVRDVLSIIKG